MKILVSILRLEATKSMIGRWEKGVRTGFGPLNTMMIVLLRNYNGHINITTNC